MDIFCKNAFANSVFCGERAVYLALEFAEVPPKTPESHANSFETFAERDRQREIVRARIADLESRISEYRDDSKYGKIIASLQRKIKLLQVALKESEDAERHDGGYDQDGIPFDRIKAAKKLSDRLTIISRGLSVSSGSHPLTGELRKADAAMAMAIGTKRPLTSSEENLSRRLAAIPTVDLGSGQSGDILSRLQENERKSAEASLAKAEAEARVNDSKKPAEDKST